MKPATQRKVFLDNHLFIYAFEKQLEPARSKVLALLEEANVQLVLSAETLVEFSLSDDIENAVALAQSALAWQPLWIRSFLDIQRDEVRSYVLTKYLQKDVAPVNPITASFNALFPNPKREIHPLEFVRAAFESRNKSETLGRHNEHAYVLKELQNSRKSGAYTPAVDAESERRIIFSRLPVPELEQIGVPVPEVLNYCIQTRAKFYKACPSLNTERHLSDYRFSNPKRNPRASDSKDLTLSAAAFPYVDDFVTQDGYLIGALQYVQSKAADVSTSINKLQ